MQKAKRTELCSQKALLAHTAQHFAMQASWGSENNAPKPTRGGELYGEVGRYLQSSIESVPWYPTRKEREQAKHPHLWDAGMSTEGSAVCQNQSTKRPAEMDVVPQGVKVTLGSKPGIMTMADHDHGTVWPPKKGHECDLPFQAMVKERKPDFHTEVNGIMIGYQGHVPRARDKVGSCPLGRVPGRPGAPSLSGDAGYKMSSQSVARSERRAGIESCLAFSRRQAYPCASTMTRSAVPRR